MMNRREFLLSSAAAAAWQPGSVTHLVPAVNHERLLLKASFAGAPAGTPVLRVGQRVAAGRMSDTAGRFWQFDVTGLAPGTPHTLELFDGRKRALCDVWKVATFPEPGTAAARFRLLIYTCAGGDERAINPSGLKVYHPIARRQRLLDRALTFQPDAVIANGDHIYWDLRQTGAPPGYRDELVRSVGRFDRTLPVLGTANEDVLKRVAQEQIGRLYGTRLRSTPAYFLQDDHDYFENDDANERMVTFPPDHLMLQLGRGTRRLYFPEFLPDANRPVGLPGSSAPDAPAGTSEAYGTLRFGQLAEILLFDCRRYLTLAGQNAVTIAREAEDWIKARMAAPGAAHVVNVPSMPPVWSAGKWGDWYADILGADGRLTHKVPKPFYQPGWTAQHDRLMQASSAMEERVPLWISGDMHAIGEARIVRTGKVDLSRRPVHAILPGPVSTLNGWPSQGRRTHPYPSLHVTVEERLPAVEENGFLLVDFTFDTMVTRFFRSPVTQPVEEIDRLEAFREIEYKRG